MKIDELNLLEIFKSYCEVLNKENDEWYGHADFLILPLPENIQNLFHYIIDDFENDFRGLRR